MTARFLALFRRLIPVRPDARTSRRITGDAGEDAAVGFFKKAGYKVLVRNWRHGHDEIDLVILSPKSGTLVFVEVKTRAAGDPKGGYFAVDEHKKSALRRVVRAYLRSVPAAPRLVPVRHRRSGAWREKGSFYA